MTVVDRPVAASARVAGFPDWAAEFDARLPISPQLVLTGNVDDIHLVPGPSGGPILRPTADVVERCLVANGFEAVLGWDPFDGACVRTETRPGVVAPVVDVRGAGGAASAAGLADLLRRVVLAPELRLALVVSGAQRLSPVPDDAEVHALHVAARHLLAIPRRVLARDSRRGLFNTVVWVVDRESDLPHWLLGADGLRVISLPAPVLSVRRRAAEVLVPSLPGFGDLDDTGRGEAAEALARSAEGMPLSTLRSVVPLAIDRRISAPDVADAVRFLRSGLQVSPWTDPDVRSRIVAAGELLDERVLGQRHAVRTTVDILSRAALGLSGAQSAGHPGRPQGVLFFAGPTGVGKTEMAKQIAEVVFGRAEAMVRFDMSEFALEHTEARLLGAPPGYVGHEAGGELTNAVRQRPFCLLLFDEIEKAHPRILDKFLQVLEDGRLTDSSGSTVHFGETLIVFTSNLGAYRDGPGGTREPIIEPGSDYDFAEVQETIRNAVRKAFTEEPINRPELLNRIGDNVVVFDFISPAAACRLLHRTLDRVADRVRLRCGVEVAFGPEFVAGLEREVTSPRRLAFGGRAVGSVVESSLVNPLARALLAADVPRRCTVVGTGYDAAGIPRLALHADGRGWP